MKQKLTICITIVFLSLLIAGCESEEIEEINEIGEIVNIENSSVEREVTIDYTSVLSDIFNDRTRGLSEGIYFYNDKMYIDYKDSFVRLVFYKKGEEIILADTIPLPSSWDKRTVGTNKYLLLGDQTQQVIWVYDLDTGSVEKVLTGAEQKIICWDIYDGKLYYCIQDQESEENRDTEIKIYVRDLESKQEKLILCGEKLERIDRISVNSNDQIGIIYTLIDSEIDHLGIIRDGQLHEIDTSEVDIWVMGRNYHYKFKLLQDKFMLCTEDLGHTVDPWNLSYEICFDGSWKNIPYELADHHVLGYVDDFYYFEDYYLVYWNKWTMSGGYGAEEIRDARLELCTLEGEYCNGLDVWKDAAVYLACSDEFVYVIGLSGEAPEIKVEKLMLEQ